MNILETLKNLELFAGLTDEEFGKLEKLGISVDYAEGEEIFHESSAESDLYLLIDGRVQANVQLDKTEQATFHTMLPGKLFGEFSFIDRQPRSATAVAIKPCKIIKYRREDLLAYFSENNHAGYTVMFNMCKILTRRIRQSAHELKSSLMWEKSV